MRRLVVVVLLAACSGSKGTPPPAVDSGGMEAPAADAVTTDSGVDRPSTDATLMCNRLEADPWRHTGMTADGQVRYVLDRCARNTCAGGCDILGVAFALTYNGRTDAAMGDAIAYTRTHHNYNDSLIATLPDRVLRWRIVLDEGDLNAKPQYFVRVDTPAGAPILPDTEVIGGPCVPPQGCGG